MLHFTTFFFLGCNISTYNTCPMGKMVSNPDEDRALVKAVVRGDHHALARLVDDHKALVGHMIQRIIDQPEEVEEICQDVFLRVYEKLSTFQFQSKLSTWIATIAYRTAINHVKQNKNVETVNLEALQLTLPVSDGQVEAQDFKRFVHYLIDQLPSTYRTLITLYYVEEFTYQEIETITGMPEGTVKNYLHRAKAKLRTIAKPFQHLEFNDYGKQ